MLAAILEIGHRGMQLDTARNDRRELRSRRRLLTIWRGGFLLSWLSLDLYDAGTHISRQLRAPRTHDADSKSKRFAKHRHISYLLFWKPSVPREPAQG